MKGAKKQAATATLRDYINLTKPGVLAGNVITAVAGFFLAAAGNVDWIVFVAMLVGITLVIAAACVINNYLDRDIDSVMERTKNRPSVRGDIPGWHMVAFGTILFVVGTFILLTWTNMLTTLIGVIGFVTYVWLYGAWSKRQSVHGTAVGAISGALPIAGGYASVAGQFDIGLAIVFLILFFWQFPEFYSISIYRRKEYAAAKVPLMSVVYGVRSTTIQIFVYTILYVVSTLLLTVFDYTGFVYAVIMAVTGGYWIYLAYLGLGAKDPEAWSRRMFKFSMYAILILCVMLSVGPLLP